MFGMGGNGLNGGLYSDVATVKMSAATVPSTAVKLKPVVQVPTGADLKVFVGGLHEKIDDQFMNRLLKKAGSLLVWERFYNPITKKSTNFGFAHFATRDSAITAARILNGFKLVTKCIEGNKEGEHFEMTLTAKNDNKLAYSLKLTDEDEKRVEDLRQGVLDEVKKIERQFDQVAEKKRTETEEGEIDKEEEKRLLQRSRAEIIKDEETVDEAEIDMVVPKPKPGEIVDEVQLDLLHFRRVQAKDDIISIKRRRRLIQEVLSNLREKDEEERKRKANVFTGVPAKSDHSEPAKMRKREDDKKASRSEVKEADFSEMNISFDTSQKASRKVQGSSFVRSEREEDREQKSRKLVPINYTEEDEKAVKSKDEKLKEAVDAAIMTYLEAKDEKLSSFVVEKIKGGISKRGLVREVKDILEDDAHDFAHDLRHFLN